jgi:small-conductance mechanosensitive channel
MVLDQPEPAVYFLDFGSDALMFDLRAYLAEIGNTLVVSSDLRFAILRALRDAKIDIPFPQRDLHIKSGLFPREKEPEEKKPAVGREHLNTTEGTHNEIEE